MTFLQLDALRRIENRARSLRASYAYSWQRATDKGVTAYAAALVGCAQADLQLLRDAYRLIRDEPRVEVKSPVIENRRTAPLGSQERTVREDLHVLDVLRENHVLRVGDDDLDQDLVTPLEEALDAYYEDPELMHGMLRATWLEARAAGGDADLIHDGRTRITDVRWEFTSSGDEVSVVEVEDVHSNERTPDEPGAAMKHDSGWEAGPDSVWRSRKRRTHTVPMDLEVQPDPLSSLAERQRLAQLDERVEDWVYVGVEANYVASDSDAAAVLEDAWTIDGTIAYDALPEECTIHRCTSYEPEPDNVTVSGHVPDGSRFFVGREQLAALRVKQQRAQLPQMPQLVAPPEHLPVLPPVRRLPKLRIVRGRVEVLSCAC